MCFNHLKLVGKSWWISWFPPAQHLGTHQENRRREENAWLECRSNSLHLKIFLPHWICKCDGHAIGWSIVYRITCFMSNIFLKLSILVTECIDRINDKGAVVVDLTCDNPATSWAMLEELGARISTKNMKVTKKNILGIPILHLHW